MPIYKLKINKSVIDYYVKYGRKLPWRMPLGKLQDPYLTLVSEVMLQQTRVSKVTSYYFRFINKWKNIDLLANADVNEILALWSGLGYYKRALNLHKSSKIIQKEYNSRIPSNIEDLLRLPGIGEYTAAAICTISFGKYAIVIDGNISRVVSRLFALNADLETEKVKLVRESAEKIFPKTNAGAFAQSLMDIGSLICLPINPRCYSCPK